MKKLIAVLKKHMGPTRKKNKLFSKTKLKLCTKQKKFGGTHEFCFTNMKTVLQVCTKQACCFFFFFK